MNLKRILLSVALLTSLAYTAMADKGMWLLNELNKQNIERMKELGFKLSPEQLYTLGKPSVASAVVIFGNGCTGITVSNSGLIFTNHHCGYGSIQSQSSVEHDYLRDGFTSQTLQEELPIPGLTIRYLRDIIDVTPRVNEAVKGISDEMARMKMIQSLGETIAKEYTTDDFTEARMTPYYAGNKYYVVVYNVFKDIRMVMAPPSSVGKFGGDTDNWMWTRHTGDFSVFRVYANAHNKPALYSKDNKPYQPISFAPVSLNGYREGDYAMTIGFPGSTNRYLTSWGVEDVINNENNPRIEVRTIKLSLWKEAMATDQATRIMYASKYAGSANYWKNAIGMNRGLKNLDVVNRKRAEEKEFTNWVEKNKLQKQYGSILSSLETTLKKGAQANRDYAYLSEALWAGTEVARMARTVNYAPRVKAEKKNEYKEALAKQYKDYSAALDAKVLPAMLDLVRSKVSVKNLPSIYKEIDSRFQGDTKRYAAWVFEKSIVPYVDKVMAMVDMPQSQIEKMLKEDPAVQLFESVFPALMAINDANKEAQAQVKKGRREYFAARQIMNPERPMPSDANFTMRMSYGAIKGYAPKDGAWYNYYTTEKGVFEKQDPTSSEFAVQPEILALLKSKKFGQYAAGNGNHLRLCFLSDNDITGGNSGSPVFNGNGELIGLAFDGNWEAMSGDIEFEPELQRTISVDIRYVLFMIDKWAKMPRLIKELNLVQGNSREKGNCSRSKSCPAKKACPAQKVCPTQKTCTKGTQECQKTCQKANCPKGKTCPAKAKAQEAKKCPCTASGAKECKCAAQKACKANCKKVSQTQTTKK